jgi:hypothetical protein
MTFDEWWEEFESVHPDHKFADSAALRKAAYAAGKLEAAQHILDMWKEQMAHETSFQTRLLAYVRELK